MWRNAKNTEKKLFKHIKLEVEQSFSKTHPFLPPNINGALINNDALIFLFSSASTLYTKKKKPKKNS